MKKIKKIYRRIFGNYLLNKKRKDIFVKFKEYSMIPEEVYRSNLALAEKFSFIKGDVVECGTWKGGMIAGIAVLFGSQKKYYLFDSFEGLPPAKDIDGDSAKEWQSDTESSTYFDNCTASENDAHAAMSISGVKNFSVIKGWFSDTLPLTELNNGISLLRMDADWYDSTMQILNTLFDQVNKGGVIIVDDYYVWDGCSKAIHDYLALNKRTERIQSYKGICYIVKN